MHFICGEFFVILADEIIPILPNEQILLECRLFVVGGNTGLKTASCCFDVAVTVVNANNNGVVEVFHISFLSSALQRSNMVVVLADFVVQFLVGWQHGVQKIVAVDAIQ